MTICVMWRDESLKDVPGINTLTYGDGSVRTYRKDRVDGRVGELVHIENQNDLIELLRKCDGTMIGVPITLAKKFFDKDCVFAEA